MKTDWFRHAVLEVVLDVDRTAQSDGFSRAIYGISERLLRDAEARFHRVRVWLVSHGDLDDQQEFVLHTEGGTPQQVLADLNLIRFGGGGDVAEHHFDAVRAILDTIPFSSPSLSVQRAIVIFATGPSKPCRSGLTPAQLGSEMKRAGLIACLVGDLNPEMAKLISSAAGIFVPISLTPSKLEVEQASKQVVASLLKKFAMAAIHPN